MLERLLGDVRGQFWVTDYALSHAEDRPLIPLDEHLGNTAVPCAEPDQQYLIQHVARDTRRFSHGHDTPTYLAGGRRSR
jgi:hypothetical protein